ncbi:hypothetical protein [Amycolatopsis speibonae]|uniref:Uncharacterized protein n=1 Tax=Amycolatopsis speibonae TaxID=1450224 RepID=A0ABV7PFJ7_9PSEU
MTVASFNAVIEMNSLYLSRPGTGASDEAVAAWYRAKGRLHERVAAQGGSDAAQELAYAATSYEHARRLEQGSAAKQSRWAA